MYKGKLFTRENNNLEVKYTGAQLFRAKNGGKQLAISQLFRGKIYYLDDTKPLRAKTYWNTAIYSTNTGTQLFREKIYWDTAIKSQNILGHSYLEATHTGT